MRQRRGRPIEGTWDSGEHWEEGNLGDSYVIEVWSEGEKDIDNYNLSVPYNFFVVGQKEAAKSILEDEFGYN